MSKWTQVFLLSAVVYCNISTTDGSDTLDGLYKKAKIVKESLQTSTANDWYTLKQELFRLPFWENSIKVEGINDFLNSSRGFLGTANHFYTPLNYVQIHSVVTKSEFYPDDKICKIFIIHFCYDDDDDTESKGLVSEIKIKFNTSTHELVGVINEDTKMYFDLLKAGQWSMVLDEKYPDSKIERDDAWEAAMDSRGIKEYSLFFYNCDHYVTGILKNSPESRQVIVGLRMLSTGLISSSSSGSALYSQATIVAASQYSQATIVAASQSVMEALIEYYKAENMDFNLLYSSLKIFQTRCHSSYPESPEFKLIDDFIKVLDEQQNQQQQQPQKQRQQQEKL